MTQREHLARAMCNLNAQKKEGQAGEQKQRVQGASDNIVSLCYNFKG